METVNNINILNCKIIFCIDSPGYGGSEINLMKLVKLLKKSYEISFITAMNPCKELKNFIYENQFEHSQFQISNKLIFGISGIIKSYQLLNKQNECVYIYWSHHINSNRWLQLTSALLRKKIIVVEQLLPTNYCKPVVSTSTKILKRFISSRAYKTVICAYSQEYNYRKNFNTNNTLVIPNTRNINLIYKEISKLKNGNPNSSDFVICCVGRLANQKNQETLVKAFKKLKTKVKVKLVLVGDGENKSQIQNFINDQNIKNVLITGFTDKVNYYLATSHLFVLPSYDEGLPGALIEAMAAKLPCIASNIPGNNELIIDKVTGYIFEPNDVDQLSNLIEFLIANPNELNRIAECGFNKVLSEYNETIELKSWLKLLSSLS